MWGNNVSISFPLQGNLISGSKLEDWLRNELANVNQRVWLCSAYIKSSAFLRLLSLRKASEKLQASVLVRWQVQDLISGASDLDLFLICREQNINLYMRLDFHGKVYAIPPKGISVGSTNATASGLGFGVYPNGEVNTLVACTDENLRMVQDQFRGATQITEALYKLMCDELEALQTSKIFSPQWSENIMLHLQPPVSPMSLLVDECLLTDGRWWRLEQRGNLGAIEDHDLRLLGLVNNHCSKEQLRSALRNTKFFRWLLIKLSFEPQHELYFGSLTAALHDALLDDPGPRRSKVKTLLQNLLSWVQLADFDDFEIDRPRHSQRVRLTTKNL